MLGRKAARWVQDYKEELRNARPKMPQWLNDRAADAWEPLFAIADFAAGDWRQRCEEAALALLSNGAIENESPRIKLLSDIREIFDETKGAILFSREIVERLITLHNRPWAEWGKGRKPITATAMSRLLAELLAPRVKSGTVRKGDRVDKGYHRKDLEDAFLRYLPEPLPSKGLHGYNLQQSSRSSDAERVTSCPLVTFSKSPSAAETAICNRVTFSDPFSEGVRANGGDFDEHEPNPDCPPSRTGRGDGNMELPLKGSSEDDAGRAPSDPPKTRGRITL